MSKKKSHNENLNGRGHWTVVFDEVILSHAWKQMSFGARLLYFELRRRFHNNNGHVYCSQRDAGEALGHIRRNDIANWFRELSHYGFIAMTEAGALGVDGKGKAPHWRLTELPTRKANGIELEAATKDFLRWDGTVFEPHVRPSRRWTPDKGTTTEKQNPGRHVRTTVGDTSVPEVGDTFVPPNDQSGTDVSPISAASGGTDVSPIVKLAISGSPKARLGDAADVTVDAATAIPDGGMLATRRGG
jgi:hypothetical protein